MKKINWKKYLYIAWIILGIGNIERFISKYYNPIYPNRIRIYYILSGIVMFIIGLRGYIDIRKEQKKNSNDNNFS